MRIYVKKYQNIKDLNYKNILIFDKNKTKSYFGTCRINDTINHIGTIQTKKYFRPYEKCFDSTSLFTILKESFNEMDFYIVDDINSIKILNLIDSKKDFLKIIDNIYILN